MPRDGLHWTFAVCGALLGGAGLGFLARDLLGLEQPVVAIAWLVGVAAGLAAQLGRERRPG
jgi:hypothetical protein